MAIRTDFDTTTNKDLFRGGLRKIFDSTLQEVEVAYKGMYNTHSTDKRIERDLRMAGLPLAESVAEGANIPIADPKLDTIKEYTQAKYGSGFRITYEMKRFNEYGLMKKWTRSLSRAQKITKDIEAHRLWNSPTATYTGYDTQVLGYASHTCLDDSSSTYDNIVSAALSTTSIESALYYFKKLKDDQGQTVSYKPDTLYFEPTLMFQVDELLGSAKKPWEESNTTNVYTKFGLKPFDNIRLTSTTAWGVLAKNDPDYDVNIFTSLEPDMRVQDAPDTTQDTIVTSKQLFVYGFGDPRLVLIGNT